MTITKELSEAYFTSKYVVSCGHGKIILPACGDSADLRALLQKHNTNSCAFITAYNPESIDTDLEINETNQMKLLSEVSTNWDYYQGYGVDQNEQREPEPSLLILGISLDEARKLSHRYHQNAFLFGRVTGRTELIATNPEDQSDLVHPLQKISHHDELKKNSASIREPERIEPPLRYRIGYYEYSRLENGLYRRYRSKLFDSDETLSSKDMLDRFSQQSHGYGGNANEMRAAGWHDLADQLESIVHKITIEKIESERIEKEILTKNVVDFIDSFLAGRQDPNGKLIDEAAQRWAWGKHADTVLSAEEEPPVRWQYARQRYYLALNIYKSFKGI